MLPTQIVFCSKCGFPINLRIDRYLSHSNQGITVFIHRPCPIITEEDWNISFVVANATIRFAQVSARRAIAEFSALLASVSRTTKD